MYGWVWGLVEFFFLGGDTSRCHCSGAALVAMAPCSPGPPPAPGSWGAKALGGRPGRPAHERREQEQGSPAHAVPSVGGVGREWGKEQWWEFWEGAKKGKPVEKYQFSAPGSAACPDPPRPRIIVQRNVIFVSIIC